jgi:hypoxanthine phosphoribosyltransferase
MSTLENEQSIPENPQTTQAFLNEVETVAKTAKVIFTRDEVEKAIDKVAHEITAKLSDKNPILLSVMQGAVVITGGLLTRLYFPLEIDYIHATRYRGKTQGDKVHWLVKPNLNFQGRNILIVDDVLDGGLTLAEIVKYCHEKGAASVQTVVLVDKKVKREVGGLQEADFVACTVGDDYIFGYGMDYKEYLRNASGIFAVDKSFL